MVSTQFLREFGSLLAKYGIKDVSYMAMQCDWRDSTGVMECMVLDDYRDEELKYRKETYVIGDPNDRNRD